MSRPVTVFLGLLGDVVEKLWGGEKAIIVHTMNLQLGYAPKVNYCRMILLLFHLMIDIHVHL